MMEDDLKGVIPAAILPMDSEYRPDYDAFAGYLDWLIGQNAVALAINMDTGEGPQLSVEERRQAVRTAAEVARGRALVLAGVMASTTDGARAMARVNAEAGADGLVVFPNTAFRNDPLDPRIPYDYHRSIADEAGLPIVLFQLAPVFGGVLYTRQTLLELCEIPQVVAIKDASFDAQYFAETKKTIDQVGRPITVLSGNDRFITECFLLGAEGALLGFAAVGCGLVADMLAQLQAEAYPEAVAMREKVQGFADVIYSDPVLDYRARCKVALGHLGVISPELAYVRPPLLQIGEPESEDIRMALVSAGMLGPAPV